MKERQSNIELLRILSMFFIVLEHIVLDGTEFFSAPVGHQLLAANSILGFTYVGVNVFILITGYFGADFSWKRLLSLYLICGFYELVSFIIAYLLGDAQFVTTSLSYIIFPLSRSSGWFVHCYVVLLFLLPLINAGLNNLDKKGYIYVLVTLTILNLYFGWFHKQEDFNASGYNASQMVYVYVIGRYLKQYVDWSRIRSGRGYIFMIWLILSILWGVTQTVCVTIHTIPHWNGWAYNNPVVLASAIALFMLFGCMEMKPSRTINMFAVGMFSVYLIHMNRYLGKYLYQGVHSIIYNPAVNDSLWLQVIILVAIALVVLFVLSLVDMPRAYIHKWIMSKYDNVVTLHTHAHTARINNMNNIDPV